MPSPPRTLPFPLASEPETSHAGSLPPDHFLSRPETSVHHDFFTPRDRPSLRPDISTLASADFDVDPRSGFLPPDEPLRRLPEDWAAWENALTEARNARANNTLATTWTQLIHELPILLTEKLDTVPLLRRASVVLGFLSHFYIHATHPGREILPKCLALPWVQVNSRLGVPVVLAYAQLVLWNWRFRNPAAGFHPSNLEIAETFTELDSERHFYMTSLLVEVRGVNALRLMSRCLDEAFVNDELALRRIVVHLQDLAKCIADSSQIISDVKNGCIPSEFYWYLRPYFVAGKRILQGTGDEGEDQEVNFVGASAGQSSMIHSYDAFLGVNHGPKHGSTDQDAESSSTANNAEADDSFMQEMQLYMPHHHRAFLFHLANHKPSIRDVILTTDPDLPSTGSSYESEARSQVKEKYDACLTELKKLRDSHFKIVALYIISQSHKQPPADCRFVDRVPDGSQEKASLKGTGGTELVRLLKKTRENTWNSHLEKSV